jgi:hypothetical protein
VSVGCRGSQPVDRTGRCEEVEIRFLGKTVLAKNNQARTRTGQTTVWRLAWPRAILEESREVGAAVSGGTIWIARQLGGEQGLATMVRPGRNKRKKGRGNAFKGEQLRNAACQPLIHGRRRSTE